MTRRVDISLAKALREKGGPRRRRRCCAPPPPGSILRAATSAGHLIRAQVALGQTLMDQGRHAEALPVLEQTFAMSRDEFGAGNWRAGEAGLALGACLAASGQHERAEPILRVAYTALETRPAAQPRVVRSAASALAEVYQALGRPDEARRVTDGRLLLQP